MTTHDRHLDDVPTLTEVRPKEAVAEHHTREEATERLAEGPAPERGDTERADTERGDVQRGDTERLDTERADTDQPGTVQVNDDQPRSEGTTGDHALADEQWKQPEWSGPATHQSTENDESGVRGGGERADQAPDTALFADDELAGLRARWDNVQAGFVDDPKDCVQRADGLVSDLVGQLTSGFTDARSRLEQQWARGEEATTEDLRIALKRYRDFFDRLLSV